LVSAADLAFMRKVQADNLMDTCVVARPTRTNTGYGGWTTTWADVDTYPCRFWISSGPSGTSQETHYWGEQETDNTVGFITLAWDADVQLKDRIIWTSSETGAERTFYITGIQVSDTFVTATRVRVESLRPVE
jgi:hypothetical protein